MKIDRNWWIVLGLALGVTVSNSFARFAYGLILPAMQSDLGWTYTSGGLDQYGERFGLYCRGVPDIRAGWPGA